MAENYNDILKVRIGRVTAKAVADNYFPIIGQTVKIDATTRWGKTSEWQIQNGNGNTTTEAGKLTLQKDSKSIAIANAGELKQKFVGRNSVSEVEVIKAIYAMEAQTLPYFNIEAVEVVRVGEIGNISVSPENGYPDSRERTIEARIYKENETANPVKTLSFDVGRPTPSGEYKSAFQFTEAAERGVYDVEIDVTDTETGITLSQRHNKLITVTPKLCPKPADTTQDYEVAFTYSAYTSYVALPGTKTFECRLWRNVDNSGLNYAEMVIPQGNPNNGQWDGPDCSMLPAGTTLVIKRDPQEPKDYPIRLFLKGNKSQNETNENGTPNFTREAPLIITHDEEDVMQWGWRAYGAFSPGQNMRNVVIDGYGYHKTGIHFYPFDSSMFTDSCLFINNGSSFFEIFGLDIDGAGFAGISAKTDPNANNTWFWRENGWEMYLDIHHCTFRNTVGEGVYVGYFDTSEKEGTNSNGEIVKFHAHIIRDLRVYRCSFIQNGYDSVQINNARGVEFCYNLLDGCGYRREPSQGSAFSCTMDGKIYNCTVKNNYNIIGVFGPFLSGLEIFNCILTAARLETGWALSAWTSDSNPEEIITGKYYNIHNNVVKAATIARLTGNVSYEGYTMDDNIFITENGDMETPGYFGGSGNIFLTADLDYENIDSALKVADSANYNYQPAYNSPAVTAGKNGKSPFDMRGYKNWYIGNFHAGPFMGKYKDASVIDAELALTGIVINKGAASTYVREVNVLLQYNGNPSQYRLGETADLSGVAWKSLGEVENNTVSYNLSDGFGNKTLYAQVGNANQESSVVSSSIEYQKEPVAATMTINGGNAYTTSESVKIVFAVTGAYTSLQYMLSESADFAGASYVDYTPESEIDFTLSGKGEKTIYGRLKADDGQIANASAVINYVARKCIISLNSYNGQERGFDSENGITKPGSWPINWDVYDVTGEVMGHLNYAGTQGWVGLSNQWGATSTGDNSGIYPDKYLTVGYIRQQTKDNLTTASYITVSGLNPGTYKIRTLHNGHANWGNMESAISAYLIMQGTEYVIANLGVEQFRDNWHDLATINDVIVGDDGLLTFTVAADTGHTNWGVPLNMIEIEEA